MTETNGVWPAVVDETTLQRYIEVSAEIKSLEKEQELLKSILIDVIPEKMSRGWYTISKITSNTTVLKKWVELSQIVEKIWGWAIKQVPNMEFLKETPEAFEFLELKPTSYIKLTKEKESLPTDPA